MSVIFPIGEIKLSPLPLMWLELSITLPTLGEGKESEATSISQYSTIDNY